MSRRRGVRSALVAVVVLGSLLAWPSPGNAAGLAVRRQTQLLPGLVVQDVGGGGQSIQLARIGRGAPVRVEAIAAGAVAGGVETTSSVCRRVGGIVCVNGDFSACRTCSSAFGGIIHDGALQRSPVGNHPQLWLGPEGPGAGPLGWSGTLEATLTYSVPAPPVLGGLLPSGPPTERVEKVSLGLDAVNRGRAANQVVLYTPQWAATTITPNGGDEAVLGGAGPNVSATVPVTVREWKGNVGNNVIPRDGMVLSADGAGTSRMRAFWSKAGDPAAVRRSVTLRAAVDRPVEESVGGHPVILANGRTLIAGSTDPFATGRNPRTLVGWNPAGELLLLTVDGRQPGHSDGVSLAEAADVLRQVGATTGFNLDGGGSTTFVSLPPGGRTPQVLNRPSDGSERRVTTILAVVPADAGAVRSATSAAAPPPPAPPPAPAGPPPVDVASTDGLPARPADTAAAAAATTTTIVAPSTTAAPSTTEPPSPTTAAVTATPELPVELAAAPAVEPALPDRPGKRSTTIPAAVAIAALAVASGSALRTRRARRAEQSVEA